MNACLSLQVSDPVAAEFSLNTQLLLLSKRALWLSDGSMGFGQESDTAFSQGNGGLFQSDPCVVSKNGRIKIDSN